MKRLLSLVLSICVVFTSFSAVFADEKDDKEAFVTRLYENFLGRQPDEAGLNDWIEALDSGMSGADLFIGFYQSEEFNNMNLSVEEHVRLMYITLLNREPDEEGFAYWVNKINNGCTRDVLLEGFLNSPEFTGLCNEYGIVKGSYYSENIANDNSDIAAFIARLYRYCLGREYDREGLESWISILLEGKKGGGDVALDFFHSEEFTSLNTSNEEFLNIAYLTLLDREADSAGLADWLIVLGGCCTREDVLDGFINSVEFGQLCESYGIQATAADPRDLYPQACGVLDQIGWDLESALNWSSMTYFRMETDANLGTRHFADYGFTNHRGNCYVMAACFAEMAMAMGYDVTQVSGTVPLRSGGMGPHSWVYIDGLIYDPDYQYESGQSGFGITYGTPGTWRYTDPVEMPY